MSFELHINQHSDDTTVDSKEFVDAFAIDETVALSFLSRIGLRDDTTNVREQVDVVWNSEQLSDVNIERFGRASNEFEREFAVVMETESDDLSPFHWTGRPQLPQLPQPQETSRSVFSSFSTFFNRLRSEDPQMCQSSSRLPKQGQSQPGSNLKPPATGLWRQAPFRKSKRSVQEGKVGISFEDLLVPSIHRWSFSFHPERLLTSPKGYTTRSELSISMEPITGNKKSRQPINDKFKRVNPYTHCTSFTESYFFQDFPRIDFSITLSKLRLVNQIWSVIDLRI